MEEIENGRYRIKKKLGQNRKSVVYLAFDKERRHDVVLKQFPNLWQDKTFQACFETKMRAIAALQHDSIAQIYDYGRYEGNLSISSAYLSGGSLADRIASEGKLSEAEIVWILRQIGDALAFAHAQQIPHYHITPENILFDGHQAVYLTDFGIVCGQDTSFIERPTYSSPEQAAGEAADIQTDIYQLGTLLFQMLTGRVPFEAPSTSAVLHLHRYAQIPSARNLNPDLTNQYSPVLRQALAKQKEDRFQSVKDLLVAWPELDDIDVFSESYLIADEPVPTVESTGQKRGRGRWLFVGLIVLLLALGGSFYFLAGDGSTAEALPTATATEQNEAIVEETAVAPTSTPTPTATATATDTVTPTPEPSPTPSHTPTLEPTATVPPTITPTGSPTATSTPLVTFTPLPQQILLVAQPATVTQNPITFAWQGSETASYRVLLSHVEQDFAHTSDWIDGLSWTFSIPENQFGGWNWVVEDDQGGRSDSHFFWFNTFANSDTGGQSATAVPTDAPPEP